MRHHLIFKDDFAKWIEIAECERLWTYADLDPQKFPESIFDFIQTEDNGGFSASIIIQDDGSESIDLDDLLFFEPSRSRDRGLLETHYSEEAPDAATRLYLPCTFFSHEENWKISSNKSQLLKGNVIVVRAARSLSMPPQKRILRRLVPDLHLHRTTVLERFGLHDSRELEKPASQRGKKRSDAWADWVAELVAVAWEDQFDDGISGVKLQQLVEDRLRLRQKELPGSDGVNKVIPKVAQRLAEARQSLTPIPRGKS